VKYVYQKKIYRAVFFIVDGIGVFLFGIFRKFSQKKIQIPKNILVIRLDHIGDVVMATSVLEPLRRAFPSARIDFIVPSWAREILEADPYISGIISFDATWFSRKKRHFFAGLKSFFDLCDTIRKGRYDVVIDLRGDARHIAASFLAGVKRRIGYGITGLGFLLTDEVPYGESSHEIDRNMALLGPMGAKSDNAGPKLHFSKEDALGAENIKKKEGIDRPYAVLHVAAGRKEKNWTIEGFAGVITYLSEKKGLLPVIIGTEEDTVYIKRVIEKVSQKVIDLSGKVGLGELGPLCRGASLFVGLDSGPSHIAAAAGVRCVILFSGVNDPDQWAPRGENVSVICPGKGNSLAKVEAREVIGNF
jgi:heptosyltransferase III